MIGTGLYVAMRTWWRVATAQQRLRGAGVLVLLAVAAVGIGGAGVFLVHPRVVTITKTETKTLDHIVYQDRVVQVKGETVYKTRTITHTEYDPACNGKITGVTVEHDNTADTTKA